MEDKVTDSRTLAEGNAIRRRRECVSCGYRYTSYERVEEKPLMVIKAKGRREPFDRAKIERGVTRSLEKRPVAALEIEHLVNGIEDGVVIAAGESREIETRFIGETVLDKLFELDRVAYIRFASVYRHFEDLDEFVAEIKKLSKRRGKKRDCSKTPVLEQQP
jgi:transcriptional repressor NrdR